ncbi:MAG: hypothetical protein ACT4N8_14570 [Sphingosinicella sp.]|uniref:hypothetical protein n=1 Tax=Sphingosinicella sp. TaxID=1917971 RepID=UPI004037EE07
MEPLMFVMAILGCGEGDAPCRELRLVEQRYASEQACMAAAGDVLARHDDLLFPSVVAQCRRAGSGPQLLRGSEVMLPQAPQANPFNRPRLTAHSGPARQPGI